jgi:hypothetical protein
VILASAADEIARSLPERLSRPEVVVITPDDFSQPGWCYRPGSDGSIMVANGKVLVSTDVRAVITRLPSVSPADLPRIVAGDRPYVSAEVSAFLVALLTELACPVANRPSPNCLCGPFWRHERWVFEAARAGLAVEPARRTVDAQGSHLPPPSCQSCVGITVVGQRCFGYDDECFREQALHLARATGVETLTVHFGDSGKGLRFLTASPWPCLEDDEVARALLDHLTPTVTEA